MKNSELLTYLSKHPSLIFSKPKRIFMLSHMRSRSSLLSHIIGSSDEISGYSELSIAYGKKFGLEKQKVILHKDSLVVDSSVKLFDKILHNSFDFRDLSNLNSPKNDVVVMIRKPRATVKSIVTMGVKNNNNKYADINWACQYYKERISRILKMSSTLDRFFLLDSEAIIDTPAQTLSKLSEYLRLSTPLTPQYESFNKTGMKKSGDTSDNIKKGEIVRTKENEDIIIPDAALKELETFFSQSLDKLRSSPASKS